MSESKGKPPRGVFHVDTQTFVFTSPLVSPWSSEFVWRLLSPLCHWGDWKPGLSVNASTLAFSCFVVPPPDPPRGPPWSLSQSYVARYYSEDEKHFEWPAVPVAFSLRTCEPCGYTFFQSKDYFLFSKSAVSETYCSQGKIASMDVSSIWGCFAANVSWGETRQDTYWWWWTK